MTVIDIGQLNPPSGQLNPLDPRDYAHRGQQHAAQVSLLFAVAGFAHGEVTSAAEAAVSAAYTRALEPATAQRRPLVGNDVVDALGEAEPCPAGLPGAPVGSLAAGEDRVIKGAGR